VGHPSIDDLAAGKGRILHFDGPIESVFVAEAAIADVLVVSAGVACVYGKKSGTTNLIARRQTRSCAGVQCRGSISAQLANRTNRKLQPTMTTELSSLGDRVPLTGEPRTPAKFIPRPATGPINNTTIDASQQINIRVGFAEASRNALQAPGAGSLDFGIRVNIDALIDLPQPNGLLTGARVRS
jgi:pilus assembly protein CpaC